VANVKSSGEPAHHYRSKVDGLLIVVLAGVPLAVFMVFAAGLLALPVVARLAALLLVAGLFGLLLWTLLATQYSIDANTLTVRSGPFRWVIDLARIESVTATRDARSGPALSLDRLCICYDGGRQILISPLDQEAFLRNLEQSRRRCLGVEQSA